MVSSININIPGEKRFALGDKVDVELKNLERYVLDVKTSPVTVELMYCSFLMIFTKIEIYKSPTLISKGNIMSGIPNPVAMDIYKNPTVSTTVIDGNTVELKGTQVFATSPQSYLGGANNLSLEANTTYLIDIVPSIKDSVVLT